MGAFLELALVFYAAIVGCASLLLLARFAGSPVRRWAFRSLSALIMAAVAGVVLADGAGLGLLGLAGFTAAEIALAGFLWPWLNAV